jgi:hypothetical protein
MENGENQMPFDHHAPIRFQRICEIYRVQKRHWKQKFSLEGFRKKRLSSAIVYFLEESYPNIESL